MSLTTWHPPPVTHIGFSSHTSNGDYGRWSQLPNSHYSPVTLTTPTSSPWLQRKSSSSDYHDPDIFGSSGMLSFGSRQPDTSSNVTNITVSDKSSYPFASEGRKSLLSGNNNNIKNDTKTVMYTYTDPTPFINNKLSSSTYTPELYSTNESSVPSYKTNFTTTVKSAVSPWNQSNYSSSSSGSESQKEPGTPPWRSMKPATISSSGTGTGTSYTSGTGYITEPSTTRGYELYPDSSSSHGRPKATVSTTLFTTSAPGKNQSLQRSNSYHGPSSSSSTIDSTVIPYSPAVTSRTVKDKLDSWGNDRQNASAVNSVMPYSFRDSLGNTNRKDTSHEHNHLSYRGASEPRELLSSSSSSRSDYYGNNNSKPHTYESYNHGLGVPSRPNSGMVNGYSNNLDKCTTNLQQKLDEINLGINSNNSSASNSSSLGTKLRTPESPRSLLVPLSPRNSRKQHQHLDWDRYLNGDRSSTAPSGSDKLLSNGEHITMDHHRFRSATTRKPKSILKKKSAYETVSGGESWKSYFQENEFSGYGLYRQNTMPTMRQSSRAPLPQLARRSAGRRVHFAV